MMEEHAGLETLMEVLQMLHSEMDKLKMTGGDICAIEVHHTIKCRLVSHIFFRYSIFFWSKQNGIPFAFLQAAGFPMRYRGNLRWEKNLHSVRTGFSN